MNHEIVLCGIQHKTNESNSGGNQGILDDCSREYFDLNIASEIDSDSILLLEGMSSTIRPGTRDYDWLLACTGSVLASSMARPLIVGFDQRTKKFQQNLRHSRVAQLVTRLKVRFLDVPQTYEEVLELIRAGGGAYKVISPLSLEESKSVKIMQRNNVEFDKCCIRALHQYPDRKRFVVAGLGHCLRIHLEKGWRLEITVPKILESKEHALALYEVYFYMYLWDAK